MDILKIVKEDLLRILIERNGEATLKVFKDEVKVSQSYIFQAIRELENDKLIQSKENLIILTERGKEKAKEILKKHLAIEVYFKNLKGEREAHRIAHILEHYVSKEVIKNIGKLSTFDKHGKPITELNDFKEALITDISTSDTGLFEKMVSMGIVPGEKITIVNRISDILILTLGDKKFALDKSIAEKIKVIGE